MTADDCPHPLLRRQMTRADGDIASLLAMVAEAYGERDQERRRADHANRVMADELDRTLGQLELQNMRFKVALDTMEQGLCLFDGAGRSVMINRRMLEIYGVAEADFPPGSELARLLALGSALNGATELDRRLLANEQLDLVDSRPLEQRWPDGRSITLLRTADGGYLLTVADVTESREASAKIAHLARHDSLTDLPNRLQLRERLSEIRRYGEKGRRCGVFCLDLDRFKAVNDTLGHMTGDALLVAVAKRITGVLRPNDVVARLGGDEFAIVQLHVVADRDCLRLAERIIKALTRPFAIGHHRIRIGVSIGISIEDASTIEPLEALRRADLALYAAKAEGRCNARIYTTQMHEVATARHRLETDLREALSRHEFTLRYQPQLDIATNQVSAVEALLRWEHPERGEVSPLQFIGVCEELGLIDEIGRFVLDSATREASAWPAEVKVAVNLSAVQFRSGRLVSVVQAALARSGLDPARLELEVTESLMLEDVAAVRAQLLELKALGCHISLDDFGTGYSSLSYIRQFPFDRIKIDQSFVREIESNKDSLAIIRAVSGLCGSLAIKSTAEGVETPEQFRILEQENCDSVQGYLISHPVHAHQVRSMVDSFRRRSGRAASPRAA
ncbi:putative bifunctional diguanylate cyclase/phosphodiesterase [Novosphingobium piscinae]|uniref:EAL domain-containing protein n=1 Tax=Novosphingobium piscinae TaxID=1507448 RepID=A0A7X1KPQ9_9SPHN|nr:EAL domain-containing protein [Novosphingobium piscinae]MBC2668969.1 EAL domain-containing protein [Novosphingobium piscinae]